MSFPIKLLGALFVSKLQPEDDTKEDLLILRRILRNNTGLFLCQLANRACPSKLGGSHKLCAGIRTIEYHGMLYANHISPATRS